MPFDLRTTQVTGPSSAAVAAGDDPLLANADDLRDPLEDHKMGLTDRLAERSSMVADSARAMGAMAGDKWKGRRTASKSKKTAGSRRFEKAEQAIADVHKMSPKRRFEYLRTGPLNPAWLDHLRREVSMENYNFLVALDDDTSDADIITKYISPTGKQSVNLPGATRRLILAGTWPVERGRKPILSLIADTWSRARRHPDFITDVGKTL